MQLARMGQGRRARRRRVRRSTPARPCATTGSPSSATIAPGSTAADGSRADDAVHAHTAGAHESFDTAARAEAGEGEIAVEARSRPRHSPAALRSSSSSAGRSGREAPGARVPSRVRRRRSGATRGRGGRLPRTCAAPGACGPRAARSRRRSAGPRHAGRARARAPCAARPARRPAERSRPSLRHDRADRRWPS